MRHGRLLEAKRGAASREVAKMKEMRLRGRRGGRRRGSCGHRNLWEEVHSTVLSMEGRVGICCVVTAAHAEVNGW